MFESQVCANKNRYKGIIMMSRKGLWGTTIILFALITLPKMDMVHASEKYYFSSFTNAGKDSGYSEEHKIIKKDPHYGWELGKFEISGFSGKQNNEGENLVFLKNAGDKLMLDFHLDHDLNALNNNEKLILSNDDNGYDEYFGIERTDFGRGALIIKHTDYQNSGGKPQIHTDYLASVESETDGNRIEIYEEGDYEVALDYEIKETRLEVFGLKPFSSYTNYRLYFKFSVRNGNVMVFPFDVETGSELANRDYTESGFYLDFAKSQYLDINIKREVLNDGATGLVEDIRFNRRAKDGESFQDEGIYTITAESSYVGQNTVKVIYVGTSNILKAHVVNNIPIDEINNKLSNGAYIDDYGAIIELTTTNPVSTIEENEDVSEENDKEEIVDNKVSKSDTWLYGGIAVVVLTIVVSFIFVMRKRKRNMSRTNESDRG